MFESRALKFPIHHFVLVSSASFAFTKQARTAHLSPAALGEAAWVERRLLRLELGHSWAC